MRNQEKPALSGRKDGIQGESGAEEVLANKRERNRSGKELVPFFLEMPATVCYDSAGRGGSVYFSLYSDLRRTDRVSKFSFFVGNLGKPMGWAGTFQTVRSNAVFLEEL